MLGSFKEQVGSRLRRTVKTFVGDDVLKGDCPICFCNFEDGDKVESLACNKKHMFHEACYMIFITTNEKNGTVSICPLCRKPIDKTSTTKKVLEKKDDDPFEMKNNAEEQISDSSDPNFNSHITVDKLNQNKVAPINGDTQELEMPDVVAPDQ